MRDVNVRSVSPQVMIEMLVLEGVTYAGWLSLPRLRALYNAKCSASRTFMTGGFKTSQGRPLPFSTVNRVGYLPGDRAARRNKPNRHAVKKYWWEDL